MSNPISVETLERLAARGWQADENAPLGEWLLRAAGGFTGRANSALVVGDPGTDLAAAFAAVVDWYRSRDLPPRLAVPLPTHEAVLAAATAAGWQDSWGAIVMVRPLDGLDRHLHGPGRVTATPSPQWLASYHYRGGALPDAGVRVLGRGDAVGFAEVVVEGQVVAIGRGSVTDGWLGVTAVETAPTHRRRGLASTVLRVLTGWASDRGATDVYLQVDPTNTPAIAMYERAGFTVHHTYRYLVAT